MRGAGDGDGRLVDVLRFSFPCTVPSLATTSIATRARTALVTIPNWREAENRIKAALDDDRANIVHPHIDWLNTCVTTTLRATFREMQNQKLVVGATVIHPELRQAMKPSSKSQSIAK